MVIKNRAEGLYGILHVPLNFQMAASRTGLLLLHGQGGNKIGHKRSFVELGRDLEARGIATFRIDLLGEGESEELLEDPFLNWRGLKPAIDFFWGSLSLQRLLVLGDCFGGLLATYYAALEPRIERVLIWNLAQMKWTAEQLLGYEDAGTGSEALRQYYWRLFDKQVWKKILTLQIQPMEIGKRALVLPVKEAVQRYGNLLRGRTRQLSQRGGESLEQTLPGHRGIRVSVLHAPSPLGSARAIAIAKHVFQKMGTETEHVFISGVPFSQAWKVRALAEIEKRLFANP